MENGDEAANIAVAYVQRQEQLLVDYIRKTIQLEVSYAGLKAKFEELSEHNSNNLNMIKELSTSLELITVERNDLKKADTKLRDRIVEIEEINKQKLIDAKAEADKKVKEVEGKTSNYTVEYTNQIGELNNNVTELKTNYESIKKNFDTLNREYERQKQELQTTFNENELLKSELSRYSTDFKKVAKKKIPEDNTF